MVLNAAADSARYSKDFDLFHDEIRDLDFNSRCDSDALEAAGFLVERDNRNGEWEKPASFRTEIIRRGDGQAAVDWAHDSAFRFFPIVEDPLHGWRLHLFDMAVNKALALSARTVTRDYIDILELSRIYPLEAIIWAACGKDEGFSPMSLLAMMRRFAKTEPGNLDKLMARELDPIEMKKEWLEISDLAETQILHVADTLIDLSVGVAFVDEQGRPN